MDASRSNSIYGSSSHVTPNHIQYPLFVCVSNQSQPITEDNVNLFIEGLNNKVNIDGSNTIFDNLPATAKQNIANITFPDYTSGLTQNWDTVYQAENNCWLKVSGRTGTSNVPKLQVSKDNINWIDIWVGEVYLVNGTPTALLPISKNYYYKGTAGVAGSQSIVIFECS
ncbi:MAG: hypothetical protein LBE13_03410 [Bacteroidales bacterium]|jgi:hypothetical protein|nr:hypothetical protein [Bacteroidales bacterium]